MFLLIATISLNYLCSLLITKGYRKTGLSISILFSLGSLFYFKYANFAYTNIIELLEWLNLNPSYIAIPQIVLPLGISFYTFQVLSYNIDVYRGTVQPSKSFLNFSTYIFLFPHLIAGPIVRYAHIEAQLKKKNITPDRIATGIERFIIGLAKKMFIANNFAMIADTIFDSSPEFYSSGAAWIGAIAYSLQILFDFSAYSDMAIGLARVFGIDFHENFNYPYISNSIKEFWRRWHISLSTWFRDYLYIPLGGNRKSKERTYLNLFIVFLITGLWHGASWNFVFWGLWHGAFLIIERVGFDKVLSWSFKPLQHIYTLFIVLIGWVFFRADNFSSALQVIKKMFFMDTSNANVVYDISSFISIKNAGISIAAIILCFPVYQYLQRKRACHPLKNYLLAGYYIFLLITTVVVIMMLSVGTYNPFIYFRF